MNKRLAKWMGLLGLPLLLLSWGTWRAFAPPPAENIEDTARSAVQSVILAYEALEGERLFTLYHPTTDSEGLGVVLLIPGFMEGHTTHRRLAEDLALVGYTVAIPDVGYKLTGRPHAEYRQNAKRALSAVNTVLGRAADPPPTVLAGFSAGGGNAVWLAKEGMTPERMLLLDPVYPEPLADEEFPSLGALPLLTLYAPPSSCNRNHDGRALGEVPLSSNSVALLLPNATHCSLTERDPLCNVVCGAGALAAESAARELVVRWLSPTESEFTWRRLEEKGEVQTLRLAPAGRDTIVGK